MNTNALSQRRILQFWLPLASSWLLMTTEMPFISAAIAAGLPLGAGNGPANPLAWLDQ